MAGEPAEDVALPLQAALAHAGPRAENWDARAPGLWVLIHAEGFDAVGEVLEGMRAEVHRSGSVRGLFVTYVTLGLLKLRLGALPEADVAARVGLHVSQAATEHVTDVSKVATATEASRKRPAELQTNPAGDAEAGDTFSPLEVQQAGLLGHTVSAMWQLWTGGSPTYQTRCEVVPLD